MSYKKLFLRLFEAGHTGFIEGLSAEKQPKIVKTSTSTNTLKC